MKHILISYTFFVGGMIGAGLFGLPYILMHAGIVPTILLGIVVCTVVYAINLGFADVVIRTGGPPRRLPGYIGIYLGRTARFITLITQVVGLTATLLVYLVLSGVFLSVLFSPLVPLTSQIATLIAFFCLAPLLLHVVLRVLPLIQLLIVGFFLVTLAMLGYVVTPLFSLSSLSLMGEGFMVFLPYGVLLFAFWALALVPEMTELVGKKWSAIRTVLLLSYGTAIVSYTSFTFLIAGVTGGGTTEDALTGLAHLVGDGVVLLGALFAVLTTASSYIALGVTLKRTLIIEFHFPNVLAWGITAITPFFLFMLGVQQFLIVISITGAVFLGIEGILVLSMVLASRPERSRHLGVLRSPVVISGIILLLLTGVIGEIFRIVTG